jgi:hypothetical protein
LLAKGKRNEEIPEMGRGKFSNGMGGTERCSFCFQKNKSC